MQQRKRWRLLVLLFVAPAASGWNDTGHMVAALIAYDRMPSSVSAAMGGCCTRTPLSKGLRAAASKVVTQRRRSRAGSLVLCLRFDLAGHRASVRQRARRIGTRRAGRTLQPRQLALHQSADLSAALGPQRIAAQAPQMNVSPGLDDARMNLVQAIESLTQNWCGLRIRSVRSRWRGLPI